MLGRVINMVDNYEINSPPIEDYFDKKTQNLMNEAITSVKNLTVDYLYDTFYNSEDESDEKN